MKDYGIDSVAMKLDALTGLRFFAAIWVVLFHGRHHFVKAPLFIQNIISGGNVAVGLFFILSGFVLSYNYARLEEGCKVPKREFWAARFARIYPLYFLAFVLFLPAAFAGKIDHTITTGLSTAFLLQAWNGLIHWNEPGWSLSAEAFFYLAFPLLVIPISRIRERWLLAMMFVLWVLDVSLPVVLSGHSQIFIRYHPLVRLPEFAIGMCLGIWYLRNPKPFGKQTYFGLVLALAVLATAPIWPNNMLHNGLLAPAFCLLIWGLATEKTVLGGFMSLPFVVLLGEASYGVYILQSPVWIWLKGLAIVSHVNTDTKVYFAAYCLVLTVFCVVALKLFEIPMRGWVKKMLMPDSARSAKAQ